MRGRFLKKGMVLAKEISYIDCNEKMMKIKDLPVIEAFGRNRITPRYVKDTT
jgi:hypothetical protein